MCKDKDVNRKWLNQVYLEASTAGQYFAGASTREVALNIIRQRDMHPCFTGKIDELLGKLIAEGSYMLSKSRLISCDPAPSVPAKAPMSRRPAMKQASMSLMSLQPIADDLEARFGDLPAYLRKAFEPELRAELSVA